MVNFGRGTLPWQPILWHETATNWHTPSLLFVLAFYNRWENTNVDCCINIDDDSSTSDKNFVNFGPVIPETLLLTCMSAWVHTWPKYARFRRFHQSACIHLRQTFRKYRGISRLHTKRFWLRRLAEGTQYDTIRYDTVDLRALKSRRDGQLNLAHGLETKNNEKIKIKNRVAQKKRCRPKSVEAVREEEVKLRG